MTGLPSPFGAARPIVLDTVDHGRVSVDCPPWCIGHGWQQGIGRNDITHRSVRVKAHSDTYSHGVQSVLRAWLSWAPFVELVPRVAVEVDLAGDFEAEEIYHVAGVLRTAAARLERVAGQAIQVRGDAV